jgi:asparagine synthase (glutamine-hydrolysing)
MELRKRVFDAVRETLGDSILLSGGLDTSIVAAMASSILEPHQKQGFHAYTVVLNGSLSLDLDYSKLVSDEFNLSHHLLITDFSELDGALPEVIRVLKSFDPMEIRNSVTVYLGMRNAKSDGFAKIMTGDGADELFAGYSFIFKLPKDRAQTALTHLWEVMHFSSIPLARSLGMEAVIPFLRTSVRAFASQIDFDFLVGSCEASGEVFGKFILRRAFEDMLPQEVVWRTKTPIEYGSGSTTLPRIYSGLINDADFAEKKRKYMEEDHVKIRDKEHLRYYEIYREIFGTPFPEDASKRTCPSCNTNVPSNATFCTTCGEYPI